MPAMLGGPGMGPASLAYDYDNARLTADGAGLVIMRLIPRPPEDVSYSADTIRLGVQRSKDIPPGATASPVLPEHRAKWERMLATYERLHRGFVPPDPSKAQDASPPPAQPGYTAGRRRGRPPGSGKRGSAPAEA